ncbi:hypothetical protein [Sulfitobacter donghicola]|uniref:Polysaccharide biosynthesis protein C-terminal domain-containing protein n=1 Tax=Sulfitobacter donghicola DSW-25 = KCTC 12864 = JCM 14565 TaxID=1300350 RepID=A0A073INL7_9RHOB|nr:hypothetical protein [Sulfitobacter donghicola]KEJ91051.1 hypothetical protein DSW25_01060 [Sulfitobacter donghicola DSW-25 = KCTC 12864 = JCM 14565]
MGSNFRGLRWLAALGWQPKLENAFRLVSRNIDIFAGIWLLDSAVFLLYVYARLAAAILPLSLGLVGRRVFPQLKKLTMQNDYLQFQSAAARVNLAFLMVSGGVAMLVLTIAPELNFSQTGEFKEVLVWLLLAQSTPILFGATPILMRAVGRETFYEVLLGISAAFFLAATLILNTHEGVSIAQIYATSQLTVAAASALLLTQYGIWPGLTALFHKRIKLL